MDLTTVLFLLSLPFVLLTVYFGTKNNFYESDNYKGDGCAHDVKRWNFNYFPPEMQVHLSWKFLRGLYIFLIILILSVLHLLNSFIDKP